MFSKAGAILEKSKSPTNRARPVRRKPVGVKISRIVREIHALAGKLFNNFVIMSFTSNLA
jgi:hypothetical protein